MNFISFIQFVDRNITAATMKVYGVIEHVSLPFPLDNPNACLNSGIKCPMSQGAGYEYQSHIFVKEVYPSVSFACFVVMNHNFSEVENIIIFIFFSNKFILFLLFSSLEILFIELKILIVFFTYLYKKITLNSL